MATSIDQTYAGLKKERDDLVKRIDLDTARKLDLDKMIYALKPLISPPKPADPAAPVKAGLPAPATPSSAPAK
jgi:hypothetical protein